MGLRLGHCAGYFPIMTVWSLLCAQERCPAGTVLGLIVPVKRNCNTVAYKDVLYNCVLPNLCQQFGEETCMGVMVRCPVPGVWGTNKESIKMRVIPGQ